MVSDEVNHTDGRLDLVESVVRTQQSGQICPYKPDIGRNLEIFVTFFFRTFFTFGVRFFASLR